jgi:hypothetical protein
MDVLPRFMAYARDFELTLKDDDWTRLRPYFAADAVYEVKSKLLGCRLTGPDAIFAGMKKSLDGFDRKFPQRHAEVTSGPSVSGDEMTMAWKVTYTKEGLPPFVLPGRSTVRYAGDLIAYLEDAYDAEVEEYFADWQRRAGVELDPRYA